MKGTEVTGADRKNIYILYEGRNLWLRNICQCKAKCDIKRFGTDTELYFRNDGSDCLAGLSGSNLYYENCIICLYLQITVGYEKSFGWRFGYKGRSDIKDEIEIGGRRHLIGC